MYVRVLTMITMTLPGVYIGQSFVSLSLIKGIFIVEIMIQGRAAMYTSRFVKPVREDGNKTMGKNGGRRVEKYKMYV